MLLLLSIILAATLLGHIVLLYRRRLNYWQWRHIPCQQPHWLWGNLKNFRSNPSFNDLLHKYYQQYRDQPTPIVGVYLCLTPIALVTDPQLAKRILIQDFAYFRNRGFYHNPDDLSANLFNLEYDKWKSYRAKLSPIFTSGKLKSMMPNFMKATTDLVAIMQDNLADNGNILDVKDLMLRFTVEVIGSCAFGLQTNCLSNPQGEFNRMAQEQSFIGENIGVIPTFLIFSLPKVARLLRLKYMPKYINDFYTNLVKDVLELRKQQNIQDDDVLGTLDAMRHKDSSAKLSLNEITAQAFILFQAGYEASACTLTYALYELARREDLQQQARAQICSVLRKHDNVLSFECLKEMKYVEQILKETLRLYPISPNILRQCTEDYKIPEWPDIIIPKGQLVCISAYSFQRDEHFYEHPDTFNPDNFAPDRCDSNILLSFGDGPRNCIGMRFARTQILVGLSLLLTTFTFSVCEKTETNIVRKKSSILIAPQNEVYLKVNKYKNMQDAE